MMQLHLSYFHKEALNTVNTEKHSTKSWPAVQDGRGRQHLHSWRPVNASQLARNHNGHHFFKK